MGFLVPAGLALAALALPIVLFYMLKLRRQPARVSSLLLWQQVLQDRQANAPWQRLKRNLLLLLQLIILALLVMALARPYLSVQARVQGNVVLLLDASVSMQATDVAPSRFDAARRIALDLIERLEPDDAVTLIAVEQTPHILTPATTDRDRLRRALVAARASYGPADWQAALTLAAANAASLPEATVTIVSDGAFAAQGEAAAADFPPLAGPVEFITVGQGSSNQGLVALALRDGLGGPELFARVANAAPEAVRRRVEIRLDGQLFEARNVDIPAEGSAGLTVSGLPFATRQVETRLAGADLLPADDVAWAVRNATPAQVLLVGEGNLFLERVLALLPNVAPQRAAPGLALPQTRFDLIIFDRVIPAAGQSLPEGNLLFIAPPASTELFEVGEVFSQTGSIELVTDHPLLTFVQLNNLHVAQARSVRPPAWSRTLVAAEGGPLLLAGQVGGRRVAILSFDLHHSDLPLQIDFPILVVNLSRWLLPGGSLGQGQSLRAGQPFPLPAAPSASTLQVEAPSGQVVSLPLQAGAAGPTFNATDQPGIYRVLALEPGQAEPAELTAFAVNLLSEEETDIRPGRAAALVGGTDVASESRANLAGRREWWWPVVLLGLGVLLAEWWVYWQGAGR